jgi:hypothetical protein
MMNQETYVKMQDLRKQGCVARKLDGTTWERADSAGRRKKLSELL